MSNLLLLEDDISLIDGLLYSLKKNGFCVDIARTVEEAEKHLVEIGKYDLLILDVTLPDGTGFEVCENVRKQNKQVPIIFLTASDEEVNIIMGLDMGGDDYITKPFEIKEVLARVQVQLRHLSQAPEQAVLSHKALTLDRNTFLASISGTELPRITKQEFAILELLLKHPKQVFSKEDIFEYAWEEPYMGETKTLDVHISNIRKKIKTLTDEDYIETVWGIGYRLKP